MVWQDLADPGAKWNVISVTSCHTPRAKKGEKKKRPERGQLCEKQDVLHKVGERSHLTLNIVSGFAVQSVGSFTSLKCFFSREKESLQGCVHSCVCPFPFW